jgi:hypothetical protein
VQEVVVPDGALVLDESDLLGSMAAQRYVSYPDIPRASTNSTLWRYLATSMYCVPVLKVSNCVYLATPMYRVPAPTVCTCVYLATSILVH